MLNGTTPKIQHRKWGPDGTEIRYSAHTTMDFKGQEISGGNCGALNF